MISRRFVAALASLTACVLSLATPASACGDKLVALGGGVGFERIMVSRNPGHIVMLLEPGSNLAAANERFNLSASLSLAGHEVATVKSTDELQAQLSKTPTDLVMVDAERAKSLALKPTAGGTAPVIMPVEYFADGSTVPASYQHPSCVTVAEGKKGATVLKAVEHALKLRSRGQSASCASGASSQTT